MAESKVRRPSLPAQRATEYDVELARIKANDSASVRRYGIYTMLVQGGTLAAIVLASWVPLKAIDEILNVVAGKETTFNANISVTLAISLVTSIGWAVSVIKSHGRKRKIKRLRERTDELEHRLGLKDLERGGVGR